MTTDHIKMIAAELKVNGQQVRFTWYEGPLIIFSFTRFGVWSR